MRGGGTYGTLYGVKRTTIYLTDEQKRALEAIAGSARCTEAQLIREGVDHVIDSNRPRRRKPRPLFALEDPVLDDPQRVDEALEGFGGD
jgi:hypothetical protein